MFPCAKSEINQQRERQRKKDDEQINEVYSLAGGFAGWLGDIRAPWCEGRHIVCGCRKRIGCTKLRI